MTLNDVSKLLDAGFTKDEILAFESVQTSKQESTDFQQPDPEPQPEPQPEQLPEEKPEPQSEPQQDPVMSQLNENISKLIKTIQASNLASNKTDSLGVDLNKQVDTIMESLIRPIKEANSK